MHDKVPWIVNLTNPILGFFGTCFVLILIPQAANVFQLSTQLLSKRRNLVRMTKIERKVWKSLKPVSIQVATFGVVTRSLKPLAIKYIMENTMNLLLTF